MSGFEGAYQREAELDHYDRLDEAAFALFRAAGRPEGLWADLTEHEREAWRHCAHTVLTAYEDDGL